MPVERRIIQSTYISKEAKQIIKREAIWFTFSWAILYAIIGTQLSYTFSPFFGDPTQEFLLINDRGGNFFMDVIETLSQLIK